MATKAHLDDVLGPAGLRVLFQPIFEIVDDSIRMHSLECLSRGPRGSAFEKADALFRMIRERDLEADIDRRCIETALDEAVMFPHSMPMHINIHASTIADDLELVDFIAWSARAHEIDLQRIVIDIVDDHPAYATRLRRGLQSLREAGISLALDDIGSGHSSLQMILECRPDYFKIDRHLIAGINDDPFKQALVRSLVVLGNEVGARVVAEGVELGRELMTIRSLGINLVQGFLLAVPREGSSFNAAAIEQPQPISEVA